MQNKSTSGFVLGLIGLLYVIASLIVVREGVLIVIAFAPFTFFLPIPFLLSIIALFFYFKKAYIGGRIMSIVTFLYVFIMLGSLYVAAWYIVLIILSGISAFLGIRTLDKDYGE